jgi:hypothetical protein
MYLGHNIDCSVTVIPWQVSLCQRTCLNKLKRSFESLVVHLSLLGNRIRRAYSLISVACVFVRCSSLLGITVCSIVKVKYSMALGCKRCHGVWRSGTIGDSWLNGTRGLMRSREFLTPLLMGYLAKLSYRDCIISDGRMTENWKVFGMKRSWQEWRII